MPQNRDWPDKKDSGRKDTTMLDFLKGILGEAYTEEVDKQISDEIGKLFVARSDFNEVNEEVKQLRDTVKDRDGQLETLKKDAGDSETLTATIAELQKTNKEQATTHEQAMKSLRVQSAIDVALVREKAINLKSVQALLDMGKFELGEDGGVKGLNDAITALKSGEDTGTTPQRSTAAVVERSWRTEGGFLHDEGEGVWGGLRMRQGRAWAGLCTVVR